MAKVVTAGADSGFAVGLGWYVGLVRLPQAKVQTRQARG